ncbi:unnamed protein product [Blepharisma stoltei]|uniref:Lipoprotein n=1 Tax=Blepharisma stoltei TaxID=1481888 RepID=A0AAU9KCR6_9CILI|nr:unnamed protein product [Blepharisma stoltei]
MKNKIFVWLSMFCCNNNEKEAEENITSNNNHSINEAGVNSGNPLKEISEFESHNSSNVKVKTPNISEIINLAPPDAKCSDKGSPNSGEETKKAYFFRSPTFGKPSFSDLCQQYVDKEESTGGTKIKIEGKSEKKRRRKRKEVSKKNSKDSKD